MSRLATTSATVLVALGAVGIVLGLVCVPEGSTARADRSRASISNSLGDIYAVGIKGGGLHKLTPHGRVDGPPAISPNGRQLAFASVSRAHLTDTGGLRSVLSVMGIDGTQFRTLAPGLYQPMELAWSADGRRLAFSTTSSGSRLYIADLITGRVRRVAGGAAPAVLSPAWSRGGKLAYGEIGPGANGISRTVVANKDGEPLWRTAGSFHGWSPDGTKLVLVRNESHTVLVLDQAGHALMSFGAGSATSVRWAPNSQALAIERGFPSRSVWVARLRDRSERRIAAASEMPCWSPDSRLLAYAAPRGVFVTSVDNPHPRLVVQPATTPLAWISDRSLLVSRWPDGGNQDFEVISVTSGRSTKLVSFPAGSQLSAWVSPERLTVVLFNAYR